MNLNILSLAKSRAKVTYFLLAIFIGCLAISSIALAKSEYLIGSGDILEIKVDGEKELSGKVIVNKNGQVRIGWLPQLKAAGKTAETFAEELHQLLQKKYIKNPSVAVKISEYRSKGVKIIGAVGKPGLYQLGEDESLLKILLEAGGPKGNAAGEILLMRFNLSVKGGSSVKPQKIDLDQVMRGKKVVKLNNGDFVYLPVLDRSGSKRSKQSIFIFGAVKNIGSFPYRPGYTVLDAISDSDGFTKFASPNRAKIIRNKGGKKETTIRVRLNDIMREGSRGKKIEMLAGDILYVPDSYL